MFDYHLHSKVSFDSDCAPKDIVSAAEKAGLKEICFTDHYDFNDIFREKRNLFTIEDYRAAYDGLNSEKVNIRHGVEFGLTTWNQNELSKLLESYSFDFVIGSVHYAGGYDPYYEAFWQDLTAEQAFEKYLNHLLLCVKAHSDFDVLGHINYVCRYVCRSPHGLESKYLHYADYRDICDEIFKVLIEKGKGIEINTSGYDEYSEFIPSPVFVKRFRELGGEIITVGSDSHDQSRIGQHIKGALEIAKNIFGHVCTFEKRQVVFHKL